MPSAWTALGTSHQVDFNKASKILGYQRSAESTLFGINAERNEALEHLKNIVRWKKNFSL